MYYSNIEKEIINDEYYKINMDILNLEYDLTISTKDLYFFNKSINESSKSLHSRFRVGCIITTNNKIISKKHNENKTHPLQRYYNNIANDMDECKIKRASNDIHAEINAIISAKKSKNFIPEYSKIYIGRITKDGNISCSFPCYSCYTAICDIGFSEIVCLDPFNRLVRIRL